MADDRRETVIERAEAVMMPTYAPLDILPVKAEGSWITDDAGRRYLDFGSGIAVSALGHGHPAVLDALRRQSELIWHLSNVFTNEPALSLARRLTELTFADRVFFANSGAEANEAALKLARRHAHDRHGPDKHKIVALNEAFHGRTLFTVSVGGKPSYSAGFGPAIEGITHVEREDIEELRSEMDASVCAVILEPVMGEGGVRALSREYLQAARDLCDEADALLIFDEVQIGVGRSGTLFAYEQYEVVPDILTSAKGLGGGFPIGATLATEEVARSLARGTHGTTYGGNPLACAVAGAVLDEVSRPQLLANVRARSEQLFAGLHEIAPPGMFADVRGLGLLIGLELSGAFAGRAKELQIAALGQGLIVLVAGTDVLRIAPPLNLSAADADAGLSKLAWVCADVVDREGHPC